MKLLGTIVAGVLAVTSLAVPVQAQPDRHSGWHDDHHGGWNNHHRRWRHHRVCRVTWRHHHRVRTCWRR